MAGLTFNIFGKDISASKTLRGVEDQSSKSSGAIGGHFKKMGAVIGGAFAGVQVASFLKGSLDEAVEAQKVGAQTAAVLKSTGGAAKLSAAQVGNLATAISNKVGIDDEAIQSGENLLLTFTNIRDEAGKGNDVFTQTTQAMTDLSVATGQSMKTSAIQLGKALNDPVKGVTALSRVGVSFTAQQKNQIAALVKSGKTMGAQKIILHELNKEFGGSAAAQVTPAMKASVAWGNLKETIGTHLLPVVSYLANLITQRVVPAIQAAIQWVSQHRAGFQRLAETIKNIAMGVYRQVLLPVIKALIPVIRSIINWVREHRQGLLNLAKVLAGTVIVAVRIAIIGFRNMAAQVRVLIRVVGAIIGAVQSAAHGVASAVRVIRDAFTATKNWVRDRIGDIVGFVRDLPGKISSFAGRMVSAGRNLMIGLWNGLKSLAGEAKGFAGDVVGRIGDGIRSALNTVLHLPWSLPQFRLGAFGHYVTIGGQTIFPRLAQGTGFFGGGMAMVGEHGREIVGLPPGAKVMSNSTADSKMRMAGAESSATVINISVPGLFMSTPHFESALVGALNTAGVHGWRVNPRLIGS